MTLSALLPFVSVLVGAALTYFLNVYQRRRNSVDDKFLAAEAALSTVRARKDWVAEFEINGTTFSGAESDGFKKKVALEAAELYLHALGDAREAVAKCVPYRESLEAFFDVGAHQFIDLIPKALAEVRLGPQRRRKRQTGA